MEEANGSQDESNRELLEKEADFGGGVYKEKGKDGVVKGQGITSKNSP